MPPTEHAVHGASSSDRWMNCAGSINMSEGIEDLGSIYAWEGTAAHELGERCLRHGLLPHLFIGEITEVEINEDASVEIEVTEEMAEAVDEFVTYVQERIEEAGPDAVVFLEQRSSLEALNPPAPMFGTADVVIWNPVTKFLLVIDYKHGQGVVVDVVDNSQVRYYALLAAVKQKIVPDMVETVIVQPRGYHGDGSIRSDTLTGQELIAFKQELFAAVEATLKPDAPLKPGDWCKFCPAKPTCPALRQQAMDLVEVEFDIVADPASQLPSTEHLTPDQLSGILEHASLVMDWLRGVESYALQVIEHGGEIPGYKLVEGRSNRKWTDPEAAERLLARRGLKKSDRTTSKLVSPNQAEKLLKARGDDPKRLIKYWEKPEGKPKLVPAADSRTEIAASVEAEFDLLEAPKS